MDDIGSIAQLGDMAGKPKFDSPSNLVVMWRYVLMPRVIANLNKGGAGGGIQLTDATAEEALTRGQMPGFRLRGQSKDCGSKSGVLQATVAFGLSRSDQRDAFSRYFNHLAAMQKVAHWDRLLRS